jgi:hypothetical protein
MYQLREIEYLVRSEWELTQKLERERLLDPERYWRHLEAVRPGPGLSLGGVLKCARSLAALPRRIVRATPVLASRRHASGQA